MGIFFLNRGDFWINVGIFEEKFGGDEWKFLIAEVGILTQKILATLEMFSMENQYIIEVDSVNNRRKEIDFTDQIQDWDLFWLKLWI